MRRNYNYETQKDLLNHLAERVDETASEFVALTDDLTADQLRWRPAEDRWSIAECVSHLLLIDSPYLDSIDAILQREPGEPHPDAPYKTTWMGRLMLKTVDPATARRVPTAEVFKPVTVPTDVMGDFARHQEQMKKILAKSASSNLNLVRVKSPATNLLRFRLGECLHFLVIHQVRHLNQARRVFEDPDFPTA